MSALSREAFTLPDSIKSSIQYKLSSASSSTLPILEMKSARDFARHLGVVDEQRHVDDALHEGVRRGARLFDVQIDEERAELRNCFAALFGRRRARGALAVDGRGPAGPLTVWARRAKREDL